MTKYEDRMSNPKSNGFKLGQSVGKIRNSEIVHTPLDEQTEGTEKQEEANIGYSDTRQLTGRNLAGQTGTKINQKEADTVLV